MFEYDSQLEFKLQAYLGDIPLESVKVELFADAIDGNGSQVVEMQIDGPIHGAVNGFIFAAAVSAERPREHYTPRLIPRHPHAFVPQEISNIRWMH